MKFLCAEAVFDGGDAATARPGRNGQMRFIQKSYRRDETYEMDEAEVKRLFRILCGLQYEYDPRTHLPIPETEQVVTAFLDCFRSADVAARDYLDQHNDDLLDIVEEKVQWLHDHPVPIGPAEPTRLRLRLRARGEGIPAPEVPKVGEKQELKPRPAPAPTPLAGAPARRSHHKAKGAAPAPAPAEPAPEPVGAPA